MPTSASEGQGRASGPLLAMLIAPRGVSSRLPEAGLTIRCTPARIGRASDNELILTHPSVSERHAEFRLAAGIWQLADLASTNGTRVDGEPVLGSLPVAPGSRLQFGGVELIFSPHDRWEHSAPPKAGPPTVALPPAPYILGVPERDRPRPLVYLAVLGALGLAIAAWLLTRAG